MNTTRVSRTESRARTRSGILEAAHRVFLRRGFHAATLDEIADEAGFTKGAVYSNFKSKDDLFLGVLEERFERRAADYEALVVHQDTAEETMRAVARYLLASYRAEPDWWPLVSAFTTHASRDPVLRERLHATRERFLDALAATIERVGERHDVTFLIAPREAARGTGALMRGMALEWQVDPDSLRADVFEEMMAGYLRGLVRSDG
jgi:AcrR family transcriptional regulator